MHCRPPSSTAPTFSLGEADFEKLFSPEARSRADRMFFFFLFALKYMPTCKCPLASVASVILHVSIPTFEKRQPEALSAPQVTAIVIVGAESDCVHTVTRSRVFDERPTWFKLAGNRRTSSLHDTFLLTSRTENATSLDRDALAAGASTSVC